MLAQSNICVGGMTIKSARNKGYGGDTIIVELNLSATGVDQVD